MMNRNEVAIPVACQADWRSMSLRDAGRFCDACQTVVHDLSAMSEREARALLQSAPNSARCVRYVYDARNGAIVFAKNPAETLVPASILTRARRLAQSSAALALPMAIASCSPANSASNDHPADSALEHHELRELMGGALPPQLEAFDAGTTDAGPLVVSMGALEPQPENSDAGAEDAAASDSGVTAADASVTDAGEPDAGPPGTTVVID